MSDPNKQQNPVPQRESIELELEAETVTDLEPNPDYANGVRGGSDHPMCSVPIAARL